MSTFYEIMLLLTLKRQDFVQIFCYWKTSAKCCLDPEPEPEQKTFPKSEPEPQQIITVPQY
jgi:hypothetical protein